MQEQGNTESAAPVAASTDALRRVGSPEDGMPVAAGTDSRDGDPGALDAGPDEPQQFLRPRRSPTAALGWIALGLAAACVVADAVAITLAVDRYWELATDIANAMNVATVVVFVVALFAAWRRPARWLGVAAMVTAVLANPFVLTNLLRFLGG